VTDRLAHAVGRLCRQLPIKHVAAYYGLGWDRVKAIDKAYLQRPLGPPNLAGLERIAMDEFAIQRGHRYATVVLNPDTREVLWVGKGRNQASLQPFFEMLGEAGCQQLKAVGNHSGNIYEASDGSLIKSGIGASVVCGLASSFLLAQGSSILRVDKPGNSVLASASPPHEVVSLANA